MPIHSLDPYYVHFELGMDTRYRFQAQNMQTRPKVMYAGSIQDVSGHDPDTSWTCKKAVKGKKEASNTFVLPIITTMCTYNVRGHMYVLTTKR